MLLRVLDFETTGMDPSEGAAVCQLGMTDVWVPEEGAPPTISPPFAMFIDPGHPMPPEVQGIHHISDKNCIGAPSADEGFKLLTASNGKGTPRAFVAHQAEFDRKFFPTAPAPWICTRKVAMRIWPEAPNHKNQTLRYWLRCDDQSNFEPWNAMPPHRAGPDTYVTAHLLYRALAECTVEEMIRWTNEPSLLPGAIHFGKHKGTPWSQVDPSYLDWIVTKAGDMDADVVFTARHWLRRHHDDRR